MAASHGFSFSSWDGICVRGVYLPIPFSFCFESFVRAAWDGVFGDQEVVNGGVFFSFGESIYSGVASRGLGAVACGLCRYRKLSMGYRVVIMNSCVF